MNGVAHFIATAAFTGYVPIAPGTVGSAVGLIVWALLRTATSSLSAEAGLALALLVIGAWSATAVERRLGTTDPGPVVVDEVMGMGVTLIAAPFTWQVALAGFLLFRVFDIVKPPPARALERAHGGWGIMLDDLAAGLYAWAVLRALLWAAPQWLR
jgi:phosphatidylglycerophosphatase A